MSLAKAPFIRARASVTRPKAPIVRAEAPLSTPTAPFLLVTAPFARATAPMHEPAVPPTVDKASPAEAKGTAIEPTAPFPPENDAPSRRIGRFARVRAAVAKHERRFRFFSVDGHSSTKPLPRLLGRRSLEPKRLPLEIGRRWLDQSGSHPSSVDARSTDCGSPSMHRRAPSSHRRSLSTDRRSCAALLGLVRSLVGG